jgi:hypothetical protein
MWSLPTRRHAVNVEVGPFVATIGFRDNGNPCEVFFTARGKSGTDIDDLLYELGVAISKAMQHEATV